MGIGILCVALNVYNLYTRTPDANNVVLVRYNIQGNEYDNETIYPTIYFFASIIVQCKWYLHYFCGQDNEADGVCNRLYTRVRAQHMKVKLVALFIR